MKGLYEVSARHKKNKDQWKPINCVFFWWLPNLSVVNRSLAHYYACPLIGRYLDSRVFIGLASTNHHEECIKIYQVLLQVIQDESWDTLSIHQQRDNRRGLNDVSQKANSDTPPSPISITTDIFLLLEIRNTHLPSKHASMACLKMWVEPPNCTTTYVRGILPCCSFNIPRAWLLKRSPTAFASTDRRKPRCENSLSLGLPGDEMTKSKDGETFVGLWSGETKVAKRLAAPPESVPL